MKYYLEAGHAFDNASIETDCFCETVEDVEKENYEFGFLDDLLIEANQQWDEKPQGYFSLREAEEKVYSKAKQYIKELEPQLKILSKEVDEDGRVIRSKEILISELVWKLLEEDYFNSDYYARVSWYVEACIRAFEDEAVWLVGICNSQGEVIDDPAFLEEAEWQDGDWLFNGREYHSLMESFHTVLKDVDFGGFKKSELFWAIQYRIMHQNLYTNSSEQVYGMRSIYNDGENAFFDISVCGIDQISDIVLEMQRNIPLETAVAKVAEQINGFREMQSDWDEKEIPLFKYSPMIQYYVPKTLQDITDAFMNNQY